MRGRADIRLIAAAPPLMRQHGKTIISLADAACVQVIWISEHLMDVISESKTPQPVMAAVKMKEHSDSSLISSGSGIIVICHRLQDPGNLGTIIRTSEAVGAAGVAITPNTVDPYSPKSVRASMGSILRMPIVRLPDIASFIGRCRDNGFQIAALAPSAGKLLFDLDLSKPTCFIFGSEGMGLGQDTARLSDALVQIPMVGAVDSLNVSAAAAVVLYEAYRQRSLLA